MTLQESKLLKLLNTLTFHSEDPFFYDPSDVSFHLAEDLERMLPCCALSSEINGLIDSLKDKKYIKSVPTYGLDEDRFCLTQKGIHRFQISIEAAVKFLVTSILVPAVVAFITALITAMLKG